MNDAGDMGWRSLLFVPANNARYAEKARTSEADAIILDLEDAVLPEHKVQARSSIQAIAETLSTEKRDVLVRINRPLSLAIRDIEVAVSRNVRAVVVAKAMSAQHLLLLSEILEERERAIGLPTGHTKLLPLLETAEAIRRIDEIASCPRVVALVCGDEDLAADLACDPDSETLAAVKYDLVLAAALRGIRPLGLMGSIAEFRKLESYSKAVRRSAAVGLKGTLCIHPSQVMIANRGFTPSLKRIEYARQILEAANIARINGVGAVGFDGKMIDAPVLRRAQGLLKEGQRFAD
ncbi:HpcH/HpaI aldolase/citrate lyase family protein [Rhizobium leguminosarum]|uniref:HpcH/HpaI aldolase/citrate lyase family protein n=1 Tax=Rhizobium leguminosarum TaxID=384 RepID=UPI00048F8BB0|nr:CoA ester lyase [Rhizobium leguminosarum]